MVTRHNSPFAEFLMMAPGADEVVLAVPSQSLRGNLEHWVAGTDLANEVTP